MVMRALFVLCLLFGAILSTNCVRADNECDGQYRRGMYLMAIDLPAQILGEFEDIVEEKQCFEECCKLVESGCNAVSYLNVDESPFCLLANCTPFNKCTWAVSGIASVFRIMTAEVNVPSANQSDWNVANATSNHTAGNRTLPANALPEKDLVEDQSAWNIFTDRPKVFTTSTPDPLWQDVEKEEQREEKEEGAVGNYNFGLTPAPDAEHDDAPDQASETDHFRLNPATFYHYINTPAIAISVCIGVVLLLVMLLVAGKKISGIRRKGQYNKLQDEESERLSRGATDSFFDDA